MGFLGEHPKERIETTIYVEHLSPFVDDFGKKRILCRFRDMDDNILIWMPLLEEIPDFLEKGKNYIMEAIIHDWKVWRNEEQTFLKKCEFRHVMIHSANCR